MKKQNINDYNEKRFQAAFKEIELILETNLDEQYDQIDLVLDKIPENHCNIGVLPMVKTEQNTNVFGGRRGSNNSQISNQAGFGQSLLMKKLFGSQIGSNNGSARSYISKNDL